LDRLGLQGQTDSQDRLDSLEVLEIPALSERRAQLGQADQPEDLVTLVLRDKTVLKVPQAHLVQVEHRELPVLLDSPVVRVLTEFLEPMVFQVQQDQLEHPALLAVQDPTEIPAQPDRKDPVAQTVAPDQLEQRDSQVVRVQLVLRGSQDPKGYRVQLDRPVRRDLRVMPGHRAAWVKSASLVWQDSPEDPGHLGLLDPVGPLDFQGQLDHRETLAAPGRVGHRDLPDFLDQLEHLEQLERLARQDQVEHLDLQVHPAVTVRQVPLAHLEMSDSPAHQEVKDHLGRLDRLEYKVHREQLERRVRMEILDSVVLPDRLVRLEVRVIPVRLAWPVRLDHLEHQGQQEVKALQEVAGRLVQLEALERQDHLGYLV